jgi:hypothetical protein
MIWVILNKGKENELQARVGEASCMGGKDPFSLDGFGVLCRKEWSGRFRIGTMR